jgi:galactokinase
MMGAGFGGCTINLVEVEHLDEFRARMGPVFREQLGREPVIHACRLCGGTQII